MTETAANMDANYYNTQEVVLASASAVRKRLLENAGIEIRVVKVQVDEAAIRKTLLEGEHPSDPDDIAEILARTKAEKARLNQGAGAIIAADQILSFNGKIYGKPRNFSEARENLLAFSGQVHTLHSAVVVAMDSKVVWSHVETVRVWMRRISPEFVGRYLARAGEKALASTGCYELEGLGLHLIDKVEGDYFSVLGLPMLPLLDELRRLNIIEN